MALSQILVDGEDWKVVGVSRAGRAQLANNDLIGQEGDTLHLMVTAKGLADLDVEVVRNVQNPHRFLLRGHRQGQAAQS